MSLFRPVLAGACLVVAAAGLTACSDDGHPKTLKGAEDTVEDYLDAFRDRDYGKACGFWTDDYRERTIDEWNSDFGGDDPVSSCQDMLRQGVMLAEAFGEDLDLSVESISSEETDDDKVLVTVEYEDDSDDGEFLMVYEDDGWLVDDELDDDDADEEESPEPTEETSEPPAEPTAIGTPATVGPWTITVTDVDLDANPELGKQNLYNGPAKEQYLLVTYTATYNGTDRTADAFFDLNWSLTGTDSVVFDPATVTTPYENQNKPTEVRSGGTVELQVPFDVDPSVVEGGLLTVSAWTGEEDAYVDFQL